MVVAMSRGPLRSSTEICADCNAPDPKWASVNRGVLICDECCSIHRSLGRHISQVRSLKKGSWAPARLACVHQLMSSGANNIWEHALVDPTLNKQCRRKPNPRDQLHPTKADFIRAKYQFLAFTKKYKDEEMGTVTDLSKQLHSSVRTNNLETSLRLLSLGADPNFMHPERGNRAVHVAAQSGQSSQIELLIIYGADPGATDSNGKTAHELAESENHTDIAHRLIETQYELTDTLAYYLCFKKPDHAGGHHFIIPEMADSVDMSDLAKAARHKLQALPHHLFEELAMDVFDEVDRRENDTIWMSLNGPSTQLSDRQAVPFLPVNPDFSSTRNQGRQKLARFNAREFATLIIDILGEAKRRQQGTSLPTNSHKIEEIGAGEEKVVMRKVKTSSFSDDEPAYDTVASDEDYSSVCGADGSNSRKTSSSGVTQRNHNNHTSDIMNNKEESVKLPVLSCATTDGPIQEPIGKDDTELRMALHLAESKYNELSLQNKELQQEMLNARNTIRQLIRENGELKQARSQIPIPSTTSPPRSALAMRSSAGGLGRNRPHSMVETSRLKHQQSVGSSVTFTQTPAFHQSTAQTDKTQKLTAQDMTESDNGSLYDNDDTTGNATTGIFRRASGTGKSARSHLPSKIPSPTGIVSRRSRAGQNGSGIPTQEEISAKTETITKKIQELLLSAQKSKHESYVPCAAQISEAVGTMLALFPQDMSDGDIKSALSRLATGAARLCEAAHSAPGEMNGQPDYRMKTQLIIQCAYDIAKGAKILVTSLANG